MNAFGRRRTKEQIDQLIAQGEKAGRAYSFWPAYVGEPPHTVAYGVDIIIRRERGDTFHVITPVIIRGRLVESDVDFIDLEIVKPIEPDELGATLPADPLAIV